MDTDDIDVDVIGSPTDERTASHLTGTTSNAYTWEEEYKRSWDVIQEDESGSLSTVVDRLQSELRRKRLLRDTRSIQRGIIRHLMLIVDLSISIQEKDLKPSRFDLTMSYLESFILEYFDQNPISQLGIVITRNAVAELISELSGNPADHIKALKVKDNVEPRGEPSLQNALEMARGALLHVPSHGTREILVVFSALSTCDPGNIYETISRLKKDMMRVCVVGLAAEVQICKMLCRETKGSYAVVLNEPHYKEVLWDNITPPPITTAKRSSNLLVMGFPEKIISKVPSLCACHDTPTTSGFQCPRCQSKLCNIPTDCAVCNLTLVSSPHLARSYHHLFPTVNFSEMDWPRAKSTHCFACQIPFPSPPAPSDSVPNGRSDLATLIPSRPISTIPTTTNRYECPKCRNHFCIDCDVYIHEVLHNCPGCCMI